MAANSVVGGKWAIPGESHHYPQVAGRPSHVYMYIMQTDPKK